MPYTQFESDWLAGSANNPGRPDRPVRGPNVDRDLIERRIAEARRLRAETFARAGRRLSSALGRAQARKRVAAARAEPGRGGVLAWLGRRLADLPDGLRRARERRRILADLTPLSDRLLADIGFSRALLPELVEAMVAESQRWRDIERQVRRELTGYSDRELDDLGIRRADIPRIARSHEKRSLDPYRVRAMDAADLIRLAANANGAPARSEVGNRRG